MMPNERPVDWLSLRNATHLATRIQAYWHERGYAVQTTVVPEGICPSAKTIIYSIRSDLLNGRPRRDQKQQTTILAA